MSVSACSVRRASVNAGSMVQLPARSGSGASGQAASSRPVAAKRWNLATALARSVLRCSKVAAAVSRVGSGDGARLAALAQRVVRLFEPALRRYRHRLSACDSWRRSSSTLAPTVSRSDGQARVRLLRLDAARWPTVPGCAEGRRATPVRSSAGVRSSGQRLAHLAGGVAEAALALRDSRPVHASTAGSASAEAGRLRSAASVTNLSRSAAQGVLRLLEADIGRCKLLARGVDIPRTGGCLKVAPAAAPRRPVPAATPRRPAHHRAPAAPLAACSVASSPASWISRSAMAARRRARAAARAAKPM